MIQMHKTNRDISQKTFRDNLTNIDPGGRILCKCVLLFFIFAVIIEPMCCYKKYFPLNIFLTNVTQIQNLCQTIVKTNLLSFVFRC